MSGLRDLWGNKPGDSYSVMSGMGGVAHGSNDIWNAHDKLVEPASSDSTKCIQSDQCASGFGCVNGECVQLSGGLTSGSTGSGVTGSPTFQPGSSTGCDPDDPDSACGSMTGGANCSKPGCDNEGKIPNPDDCCGERCCRLVGNEVQCKCGPCPDRLECDSDAECPPGQDCIGGRCLRRCSDSSDCPAGEICSGGYCVIPCTQSECPAGYDCVGGVCIRNIGKGCSEFCDDYYKANGELVAGCSTGPDGNVCDECEYCDQFVSVGNCVPANNAPCWCEEGKGCADCEKCISDPLSTNYGNCEFEASGCQACTTIYNYPCPCGATVDATACKGADEGGLVGPVLARQQAATQCEEICNEPDQPNDPCEGTCTSHSYTGTVPPCPAGYSCTTTGSISGGGQTVTLRQECDVSNVPESCKECDCNCHNDCPECMLCGSNGVCYRDPKCCDVQEFSGCGTYTLNFTEVRQFGASYDCLTGDQIDEARTTNVSRFWYPTEEICGVRVETEKNVSNSTCEPVSSPGYRPILALYIQYTEGGPWQYFYSSDWVTQFGSYGSGGISSRTRTFYPDDITMSLQGSEAEPNACGCKSNSECGECEICENGACVPRVCPGPCDACINNECVTNPGCTPCGNWTLSYEIVYTDPDNLSCDTNGLVQPGYTDVTAVSVSATGCNPQVTVNTTATLTQECRAGGTITSHPDDNVVLGTYFDSTIEPTAGATPVRIRRETAPTGEQFRFNQYWDGPQTYSIQNVSITYNGP